MVDVAEQTHLEDPIRSYIVRLADATRNLPELRLGVSTRGCVSLMRCSRAIAASQGRIFVTPDDVKSVAHESIAHRLLLTPEAELKSTSTYELVKQVLDKVEAPRPVRSGS